MKGKYTGRELKVTAECYATTENNGRILLEKDNIIKILNKYKYKENDTSTYSYYYNGKIINGINSGMIIEIPVSVFHTFNKRPIEWVPKLVTKINEKRR